MYLQGTRSELFENSENRSSGLIQTPLISSDSIVPRSKSVGWSSSWPPLRKLCASNVLYHEDSTANAILLPTCISSACLSTLTGNSTFAACGAASCATRLGFIVSQVSKARPGPPARPRNSLSLANYAWIIYCQFKAIGSLLSFLCLLLRCQCCLRWCRWVERCLDLDRNVSQSARGGASHHPEVDAAAVGWFIVDEDFDLSLFVEQGLASISIPSHRIMRPKEVAELRSVVIVFLA